MKMSHRNRQFLFVGCGTAAAVWAAVVILMMVITGDHGAYLILTGLIINVILLGWSFRVSRRDEAAESDEDARSRE